MGRGGPRPAFPRRRTRLHGWWYGSIGAGFLLLVVRGFLAGERLWPIPLRWVIAAGFVFLGVGTLR
jgi:hypothetical protein